MKKKAGDAELTEEHEIKQRDLSLTGDMWVDRERAAVRDIQETVRYSVKCQSCHPYQFKMGYNFTTSLGFKYHLPWENNEIMDTLGSSQVFCHFLGH